jgi:hypothetical protein
MWQGLLVIKHRAEIAHVEPAFKEVRMNRGSAMGIWRVRIRDPAHR